MVDPTGEADRSALKVDFDRRLMLQFRGSTITSDVGLLAYRELDNTLWGLPRDWGSGCGGDCGERVVRGEEALPEAGAERAVVDGAADLEQPIGTAPRPAHLLRFVHATIDEEVGRPLGQRCANPQPGPVPFAIVDQPVALPDEVAVQRLQRGP